MATLSRKKRLVSVGVTMLVLGVIGLAYAAWTTNGSGSGYAKAGTAQSLSTVDVSATTSATLYPGTAGDVKIQIHNPNPYAVTVTAIAGSGTITADSAHQTAGCTSGASGVTYTDQSSLNISAAANSDTTQVLSGAAHMAGSSDNSCQGAVFTIPVSITGASS